MRNCLLAGPVAALLLGAGACLPEIERTPVAFDVPRDAFFDFLDVPWPSDVLRTEEDGEPKLLLRAFPNPYGSETLEEYLHTFQSVGAYAPSGGLYFRVPDGVDASSLPQAPAESMSPTSSMFLIELDRPDVRLPIEWVVQPEATGFLPAGTVSVFPLLGAVPRGTAALVVTQEARAANGKALGPSEDLLALMQCEDLGERLVEVDCAPYAALVEQLGRAAEEIALMQIVTFSDPAAELAVATQAARAVIPTVTHDGVTDEGYDLYTVFEGEIDLAQFQAGRPPFNTFDGVEGGFIYGDDDLPIVQRTEPVHFVLTVPRQPPPENGYPVAINGHGTGGDYASGLGNNARAEAHQLARAGYAMLAISEPLHFGREGFVEGSEEILTFNFLNPVAGRDLWRQSVLEKVQLVTAVEHLDIHWELTGPERGAVTFDEENVAYFGHSQGGIIGAMFVAVEDRITGAFLSGAGGGFAPSLIEKQEPVEIGAVVRTLLNIPSDEPLDRFHPLLTLLQIWVDPSDPINYGRLWREREARRVPHLVMTSGLIDVYTPKRNHGGMAAAYGLPLVAPVSEPVEVLELLGIATEGEEVSGNMRGPGGAPLTGGLLQYADDGHFAVYYNPDAQEAYRRFFLTLGDDKVPVARVRD
jgi:pimeloyl-ACP methyl ester carboxylesterase